MKNYTNSINMMDLLARIAPLARTLACEATDKAFNIMKEYIPTAKIEGYSTGSKVWTWTIPPRWEVNKAQISMNGQVLIDYSDHPLTLVNYSRPFKGRVSNAELKKHLWSDPSQPNAIPYVFKYYQDNWGFCVPHTKLDEFNSDFYDVEVDVSLDAGKLNVFYDFLSGTSKKTFIICSNICHPAQVNDSLTGVAVGIDIMNRLRARKERKYSYLFLAVPEQIGSIAYFANNPIVIENSIGGFFSEMLGTSGPMVGQKTRDGDTYFDFLMEQSLKSRVKDYRIVPFLKSAANDEKVMDSPGVDIPSFAITRAPYREYHTSDDNMSIIKDYNLEEARDVLQNVIDFMEADYVPRLRNPGPVFLSGYDLYPNWYDDPTLLPLWSSFIDVMPKIEGRLSVIEIAKKINCDPEHVFYWCDRFHERGLLDKYEHLVDRRQRSLIGEEN